MLLRLHLIFLCAALFSLAACSSLEPDVSATKYSPTEAGRGQSSGESAAHSANRAAEDKLTSEQMAKSDLAMQPAQDKSTHCQPKSVPLSLGVPANANMNEVKPRPKSREEFNKWLHSFGGLQLAELEDKDLLQQYFYEADFNNDNCQDVVLIVEGVENKYGEVSLENPSVDVTVQNLRTNAILQARNVEKLPPSPKLAAQLKPEEPIALLVVFGGENGWSWKHVGAGRTFLLYDSIYPASETPRVEEAATIFDVIERDKPAEDAEDLLAQVPQKIVGDCIHTQINIRKSGADFWIASNRKLIGFDESKFVSKALNDTKLYLE